MAATSKVQPIKTSDQLDRTALIDEFGALDVEVKAFAPTKTRHEDLAKTIRAWYPDEVLPAHHATTAPGTSCDVLVGMRGEERHIVSMIRIFKLLGKGRFLELCHIALKALEEALGKEAVEAQVVYKRTGPRKLTVLAKLGKAA